MLIQQLKVFQINVIMCKHRYLSLMGFYIYFYNLLLKWHMLCMWKALLASLLIFKIYEGHQKQMPQVKTDLFFVPSFLIKKHARNNYSPIASRYFIWYFKVFTYSIYVCSFISTNSHMCILYLLAKALLIWQLII